VAAALVDLADNHALITIGEVEAIVEAIESSRDLRRNI
jgi:hypothetical protein